MKNLFYLSFTLLFFIAKICSGFEFRKVLVETSCSLEYLIHIKRGTEDKKKIESWRDDGRGFVIESNDFENDKITAPVDVDLRLFVYEDNIETGWYTLKAGKSASILSCILGAQSKASDINQFIVPNYLNDFITDDKYRLRNVEDKDEGNKPKQRLFINAEKIVFNCKETDNKKTLIIKDTSTNETVFQKNDFVGNKICYNDFKDGFVPVPTVGYLLIIKYTEENTLKTDSCYFSTNPLILKSRDKSSFTPLLEQLPTIRWETCSDTTAIVITTDDGQVVFEKSKFKDSYFDLKSIKKKKLLPGRTYTLEINCRKDGLVYEYFTDFGYSLRKKEYERLMGLLGGK